MGEINTSVKKELKNRFDKRVNFEELERKIYTHDMGVMPSMVKPLVGNPVPDGIVQPISEEELVQLVQLSQKEKINLTPRGKATSGYGGVLPVEGGLVVEFNRMNKIIDISTDQRTATVEAGVVWKELEYHLNQRGLTLALYPTSFPSSTVGGWLAQGGAGIGSYEFGYFSDNVVSARVVLPNGNIREFSGRELELISEANGTTGLISQVVIRVKPLRPMHVNAIAFDTVENMAGFMEGLYHRKVMLWSVSFINPEAVRMKNQLPPHLHHGKPVEDDHRVILPEKYIAILSCTSERCDLVMEDVMELAEVHQGQFLANEIAQHEWEARFEPMRAKRIAPSLIPSEVVVPVEKLAQVIKDTDKEINHPFILEGFATNRREFVLLGFIPHDERKFNFNMAFGLSLTALKTAQKHGGRPYATGLYFTSLADDVLGKNRVEELRRFKGEIDPGFIMNPGKVFDRTLVAGGLKMARAFEPLVRVFGNWAKGKEAGEVFKARKGIPGDIAWYAYACSQCGYCVDHCDQYYGRGWESQSPRGKWTFLKMLLEGEAEWDQKAVTNFMSCTTCEMCNHTCQLDLPNESSWLKLRGELIDKRGYHTFPPFEIMVNTMRQQGNIWGSYARDRDAWMTDEIRAYVKDKADYAYFPGCTASFVEQDVAQSTALLLKEAGIEYSYIGKEEQCCGIPMLVSGRWEVFDETAAKNIENMKKTGATTIVTTCPACWLVWEIYYRHWAEERGIDYPFHAKHYADVLAERIDNGQFTLPGDIGRKVTYHDPCHMGRAGVRYEGPRTLINAIPGSNFREMRFNKEEAHCCGAVLTLVADPDVAEDIGATRLQEAIDTGADTLITACPCCRVQLKRSRDLRGLPIEIRDLSTLAAESLGYDIPESDAVIDEKWGVFEQMIRLMTPWGMADLMADMIPDLIAAMPDKYSSMMNMVIKSPDVFKEPMISMMTSVMPSLFPKLMPDIMPKVMPRMLEKVGQAIDMPDYLEEQMPDLMPKTMEVLMPKMLGEIIPYFMPHMADYLRTSQKRD
ncbi:Alpha-helical ferredoxin [Syntrophomonas zehnderi OL-4]|uniref:Alpha-helical ferredoxin n=1 Tax=Syntrophomonas zehnderi OL-4 TaxID=690567 RepID=A0A0E3W2Q4_9FIRM|nr:FAD-binding and (Fe-S)-binding domain-containing protein [Syntrophomonas zehnderi]CFX14195.1 Alpha-helical ferredoxin [Syntrophomonas zehnderi OL-4]